MLCLIDNNLDWWYQNGRPITYILSYILSFFSSLILQHCWKCSSDSLSLSLTYTIYISCFLLDISPLSASSFFLLHLSRWLFSTERGKAQFLMLMELYLGPASALHHVANRTPRLSMARHKYRRWRFGEKKKPGDWEL